MEDDASMQTSVKCLLVDDLEENLLALSALLREDGVELLQARSGPEALELLLAHDVALALLDVQMPDMDGFELAELIRGSDRTRHVPLIFVTAGLRDQHRQFKGYETGAVDFLYKPIEPRILRSKAGVFFQLYRHKQQLARELQERTEALRLNEMFTAVLGHDLRSPLSAIVMSAHVLQRRSDDSVVRDIAQQVLASGKRMSRMIDDLFDLARARLAGGIPIRREPADLGTVIERAVQEHSVEAPQCAIELSREGDLIGSWDAGRLAQLGSNLIGNALQHGHPDHPVRVRLDGTQAGAVVLTVANTGRIAPDLLPHLFDPFRGGQRQLGQSGGLGLGLYIVRQIVLAHQGSVEVQAEDANRVRMRVTLPRAGGETLRR
jgi:two-component system, sensor histidine kinase and response regulator